MKPMMCFDVDGTIRGTTDEHIVYDSTILALKKLKEAGYPIVVSTGRGRDSFLRTGIQDIADWDGFVFNNGQLITDGKGNVINAHHFKNEDVIRTIAKADELNLAVTLKKEHRIITKEPDEYVLETQRYFGNQLGPVEKYNGTDLVDMMIIYGPKGWDYKPFLDLEGISVLPGLSCFADVAIAGVSKATGIMELGQVLGSDHYVCFGDSQNDIEMMKHASSSICMGNGDAMTKAEADYVTADIDDDGIYKACIHFGYIKE